MTKHFVGFGLFSLIVALFVAGISLFTAPPIPEIAEVQPANPFTRESPYKLDQATVGDPRAFADRNSGKITIYINEFPGGSHVDRSKLSAVFTFYSVRGDEIRLMDVIEDSLLNPVRRDNDIKWILQYEEDWVRGLATGETLYVVPGARYGDAHTPIPAEFSKNAALPVLIRN